MGILDCEELACIPTYVDIPFPLYFLLQVYTLHRKSWLFLNISECVEASDGVFRVCECGSQSMCKLIVRPRYRALAMNQLCSMYLYPPETLVLVLKPTDCKSNWAMNY